MIFSPSGNDKENKFPMVIPGSVDFMLISHKTVSFLGEKLDLSENTDWLLTKYFLSPKAVSFEVVVLCYFDNS